VAHRLIVPHSYRSLQGRLSAVPGAAFISPQREVATDSGVLNGPLDNCEQDARAHLPSISAVTTSEAVNAQSTVLSDALGALSHHIEYVQTVEHAVFQTAGSGDLLIAVHNRRSALQRADSRTSSDDLGDSEESLATRLEVVKQAQNIVVGGFADLHKTSVIVLWSILEAMSAGVVIRTLVETPQQEWPSQLLRQKIPFSDVAGRDTEDLAWQMLGLHDVGKNGLALLERRFDLVGLSGGLQSRLGQDIIEVHQVRNVLAHRNGVIDRYFMAKCPWVVDVEVGQLIAIDQGRFKRFVDAAMGYCCTVIDRHMVRLGRGPVYPQWLPSVATDSATTEAVAEVDSGTRRVRPLARLGEPRRSFVRCATRRGRSMSVRQRNDSRRLVQVLAFRVDVDVGNTERVPYLTQKARRCGLIA
jgi:hypothetical protein